MTLQRRGDERVGLRKVRGWVRRQAEAVRGVSLGRWVRGLAAGAAAGRRGGGGLGRPHVAVVDVRLQVALGQVGALAALHHAAHVEGAAVALLDPLDRVCAAVQGQTGHRRRD